MINKKVVIGVIAIAIVVLGLASYSVIKNRSIESKVYHHLMVTGVDASEINEMIVKRLIKSSTIFSDEWTISLKYHDEPDVYYSYFYNDDILEFAGVSGGEIKEDTSEYKHYENSSLAIGIIGSADGPTSVFVAGKPNPLRAGLTIACILVPAVLIFYITKKRNKQRGERESQHGE